ncbi:LysM peptidoglycan-binding domain-containing protein [Bacillus sp. FJAT-26390]|uniref:LysM peptidoglycan-binding domain-containing protein n=1 Tax=Bacillus sp. FJAT-26390 TaxID=1743142 RepID=UPI000807F95D|nr:LysM domain-containing protein [Bacillus sp. FJAT-26390]OBZ08601.1 peptidoglycan-binding protein LysM [Bacillus sp. FJAT-26390]
MISNRNYEYGIWLSYGNQQQIIHLPVNPPEIKIGDAAGGKTYEVSGLGEINVLQSPKLKDISFESFFPAFSYPFVTSNTWTSPVAYVMTILEWMDNKRPIRFIYTGATFDINLPMSIEKFEWKEAAGSGDIEYSISLKEFAFYGARPVILTKDGASTKTNPRPSDKQKPKTYKLVAGDTLIKVARVQLGNEGRWQEIQKLNGIKDAQLRKLPVGMTLKLPG